MGVGVELPNARPAFGCVGAVEAIGVPNVILPDGWDAPSVPKAGAAGLQQKQIIYKFILLLEWTHLLCAKSIT